MLPAVNAWESHQDEFRDLELRDVGGFEILEHSTLRGKIFKVTMFKNIYDSIFKCTT